MRVLLLHLLCVSSSSRASVRGRQLYVEGARFTVRGVCYSPVPINGSVYFEPYGDYFTAEFSFIWRRDLPLIKAMGANMVRVYGWSKTADHTAFLDAAHANGLKVMATFYMVRRALATREPASATPRAAPIPTSAPAGRRAARQSRRCTPRSSGTRSSPRSPRSRLQP